MRALMERHGLPRHRQSPWLAGALGLSYAQAHRRMNGASVWSLEDLERVGALFGESLAEVVTLHPGGGGLPGVAGVVRVGAANLDCRLWLGDPLERPDPGDVVAVRTSSGWAALPASEASEQTTYRVERLEARPSAALRKVVAVLDDDDDLTDSICAHLNDEGYDGRPFYRTADLLASAQAEKFDGFVIDWLVGGSSTGKLIATLREYDRMRPIVVLTAQLLAGAEADREITRAVTSHSLVAAEKPVRPATLSALLAHAFASS